MRMILLFAVVLTTLLPANGLAQELTAGKVRASIENGVKFLKETQNADGSWDKFRFDGDVTALATLALINSGVSTQDPKLRRALNELKSISPDNLRTYVVSLRIMAFAAADPSGKLFQREIQNDVNWLVGHQVQRGESEGGWYYGYTNNEISADSSDSQFAILALHEATRVGIKVPQETWKKAKIYWRKCFRPGAGFTYSVNSRDVTGSMTCAGISSWIIINENLADVNDVLQNGEVVCCGGGPMEDPVQSGFKWLANHFSLEGNPMRGTEDSITKYYYLYALERAGRLSGKRFIGPTKPNREFIDWYRQGAEKLIKRQRMNNSWVGSGRLGENNADIVTSLVLLFLSKGKRPVVIRKLQHGPGDDWDNHPKGVHHLTRQIETQWKKVDPKTNLTWQTVKIDTAKVDDMLGGVLFMSGRDALDLNNRDKDLLKKYIENGGFIFAEACQGDGCGEDVEFDRDFRLLVKELFPGSELQALSEDHPIWNAYYKLPFNKEWPLLGLQASCRTSIVYCPRNLSGYWRLDREQLMKQLPNRIHDNVMYTRQVGVNVVSYATGRQLRDKLDTPKVIEDEGENLADRILVLPKLLHQGGSDEAPNAWRNVLKEAKQAAGLRINLEKKMISPDFDLLADHPFIFMHGRSAFFFNNEQRKAIKNYIEKSKGFILVDSICASKAFNESFRREMKEIFPDKPLKPIPPTHALWNDERFGFPVKEVRLRKPDPNGPGGFSEKLTHPLFESIEVDERLAIVYSPYDLSCALENSTVSQCEGYTRRDAAIMGIKILLYRLIRD